MTFRIEALDRTQFENLLNSETPQSVSADARWIEVDVENGYPCRVSLQDAKVGERVLAVSHPHQESNTPYAASGPIFIREHSQTAQPKKGEIPAMLRHRMLSLRGYNEEGFMLCAQVTAGTELESVIAEQFQNTEVQYLHIHNALPGCFDCTVRRA